MAAKEKKWHLQFLDNSNTFLGPYSEKQAIFMQRTYESFGYKTKVIQK